MRLSMLRETSLTFVFGAATTSQAHAPPVAARQAKGIREADSAMRRGVYRDGARQRPSASAGGSRNHDCSAVRSSGWLMK